MLFDASGNSLGTSQMEHNQVFPRAGWVEHDPMEIWSHTRRVMADVLALSEYSGTDIAALGITNQRETTVVWDRTTGEPVYNAIVWQDTRTSDICSEQTPVSWRLAPLIPGWCGGSPRGMYTARTSPTLPAPC